MPTGKFLTRLHVRSQRSGRWQLTDPLRYRRGNGQVIEVPAGYSTDLFSVPRLLWWLIPRDRRGREASVVHDYCYTDQPGQISRADADATFREALAANQVNALARWVMWAAVRIGGGRHWRGPKTQGNLAMRLTQSTAFWFCVMCVPALLLLLSSCATLTKPETLQQRLAYADSQFTVLVHTAADLRRQGLISDDQVQRIDPVIQRGDQALGAAWAALAHGTPEVAADYLAIVIRVAAELSQTLREPPHDRDPSPADPEHPDRLGAASDRYRTASL